MLPTTKERAESLDLLTPRLRINRKCQDRDFQTWLQSRLNVQSGESILDLACGDGAQSKYFDKRIGAKGYLRCVDINQASVTSLKNFIETSENRTFVVSDMMEFESYLGDGNQFTLAHCSFALPYASDPTRVIKKLTHSLQKPLGRLAISLPCKPHGMVELAKSIHPIPATVEPAIELGECLCISIFRDLFGEVDVSYFNSYLNFTSVDDFMTLYKSTTYYSHAHENQVADAVKSRITEVGSIAFKKSAILIVGKDISS